MKATGDSTSVAVAITKFLFEFATARLIVMLAWVIFSSCYGFCRCVDTRTCDRTCLLAWTGFPHLVPSIYDTNSCATLGLTSYP